MSRPVPENEECRHVLVVTHRARCARARKPTQTPMATSVPSKGLGAAQSRRALRSVCYKSPLSVACGLHLYAGWHLRSSCERSNEAGDEVPVQEPGLPPGPQLGPATGAQSRAVAVAFTDLRHGSTQCRWDHQLGGGYLPRLVPVRHPGSQPKLPPNGPVLSPRGLHYPHHEQLAPR